GHIHDKLAELALELPQRRQALDLLRGIHGVGDQFAQENLIIRIQKLLDDGKYVFRMDGNTARFRQVCFFCCHSYLLCLCFFKWYYNLNNFLSNKCSNEPECDR